MTTEELIREAEEKCSKATERPWHCGVTQRCHIGTVEGDNLYDVCAVEFRNQRRDGNASFIAWARTGVPALVAALRSERAKLDKAVEALRKIVRIDEDDVLPQGVAATATYSTARAALKAIGEAEKP